jgi:hypothetical protein
VRRAPTLKLKAAGGERNINKGGRDGEGNKISTLDLKTSYQLSVVSYQFLCL